MFINQIATLRAFILIKLELDFIINLKFLYNYENFIT